MGGDDLLSSEIDKRAAAEAYKRARQQKQREAERERQRLERISSRELSQDITRSRPPPMHELVPRDPAVIEVERECRALTGMLKQRERGLD